MSQTQILRTELLTDPQNRGYAGMSDQEAADDLNLKRHKGEFRATVLGIVKRFSTEISGRLLDSLEFVAESDVVVRSILNTLVSSGAEIDLGDSILLDKLQKIVNAGQQSPRITLTQDDYNAINMASENMVTRAEQIGLSRVKPGHVEEARS